MFQLTPVILKCGLMGWFNTAEIPSQGTKMHWFEWINNTFLVTNNSVELRAEIKALLLSVLWPRGSSDVSPSFGSPCVCLLCLSCCVSSNLCLPKVPLWISVPVSVSMCVCPCVSLTKDFVYWTTQKKYHMEKRREERYFIEIFNGVFRGIKSLTPTDPSWPR